MHPPCPASAPWIPSMGASLGQDPALSRPQTLSLEAPLQHQAQHPRTAAVGNCEPPRPTGHQEGSGGAEQRGEMARMGTLVQSSWRIGAAPHPPARGGCSQVCFCRAVPWGAWGAERGWATSVIWNGGGTLCPHTRLGKPLSPQSHSPQPGALQTQGLIWGGGSWAFTAPLGCLRQERCRHAGKDATDAKPRARVTPPCEHGSVRQGCWGLQAASEHDGQTDRQTDRHTHRAVRGAEGHQVPQACRDPGGHRPCAALGQSTAVDTQEGLRTPGCDAPGAPRALAAAAAAHCAPGPAAPAPPRAAAQREDFSPRSG